MEPVTVLVIEEGAAEAALVCAALALYPAVRVIDAPDVEKAMERIANSTVALAIAGARALTRAPDKLVSKLGARGIPVVGIAPPLEPKARERALAAGVREVHDRPGEWRAYSELVGSLVGRFIRTDSPPRRGPTS
jgi:hypothetical protein